eukprot:TRINITY_DN4278_c0_g1_i2.p1 TRINITY_DN4278_c0_g1~~TRINITY_DN4278_c0_g1_i2.p1  ORF type:complete len:189 (-),score=69.01 TRINITY_DN4278_c0_g1_i2:120-686(-)
MSRPVPQPPQFNVSVLAPENVPLLFAAAKVGRHSDVSAMLRVPAGALVGCGRPVPSLPLTDDVGNTPLHYAAAGGHVDCVRTLIAAGINPNVQNKQSETPLHRAATRGHAEVVHLLLAKGADKEVRNNSGETPAQMTTDADVLAEFAPPVELGLDEGDDVEDDFEAGEEGEDVAGDEAEEEAVEEGDA